MMEGKIIEGKNALLFDAEIEEDKCDRAGVDDFMHFARLDNDANTRLEPFLSSIDFHYPDAGFDKEDFEQIDVPMSARDLTRQQPGSRKVREMGQVASTQ